MSKRSICTRCERPVKTCLCADIVELSCDYHLYILQDPKEAKHALSSAPILAKSIQGAQLLIGEQFDPTSLFGQQWKTDCLLIFPDENSLTAAEAVKLGVKNLILLDGTWRKVSRMLHLNPWLVEIPSLAISASNMSEYQIRKSPREDGLATIEAAVVALNNLQPQQDFTPILGAFRKMIQLQIDAMGKETFKKNYPN